MNNLGYPTTDTHAQQRPLSVHNTFENTITKQK